MKKWPARGFFAGYAPRPLGERWLEYVGELTWETIHDPKSAAPGDFEIYRRRPPGGVF
jgi:hypothetical protein